MPTFFTHKIVQKPAPRHAPARRSWGKRHGAPTLLVLAALLGSVPAARAQVPVGGVPPKTYMNKSPFYLPVTFDERLRPSLKKVQLYVKEGPDKPWTLKEEVSPTQSWFTFRSQQDGEYWFNVVTVDQAGKANPANIATCPPGLIVVLDTQPPRVDIVNVMPSPDGRCVQCAIRDVNHDAAKTKFLYQTADKVWRPVDACASQADAFCIPAQAMHTGLVQVMATDMAGNVTKREVNLTSLASREPSASPAMLPIHESPNTKTAMNPPPLKTPYPPSISDRASAIEDVNPGLIPIGTQPVSPPQLPPVASVKPIATSSVSASGPVFPKAGPDSSDTPLPLGQPPVVSTVPGPDVHKPAIVQTKREVLAPTRQIVNHTHLFLEYQIEQMGQSGVGKVEVWLTRDEGQSWQRHGEDVDRKSPIEINLPGEGLFGISMVVSNGRGFGANPPQPGDTPDYWVEVDVTKPTADILGVRPEPGNDGASLLITWSARDKNASAEPIDLYYSAKSSGPWQPIAKGIKNDGQFRWMAPRDLGHAYVRLVARDAAGNSATTETAQAIALDDLSRPRARVTAVTPTPSRDLVPQGH
jgi:hypothetical protein